MPTFNGSPLDIATWSCPGSSAYLKLGYESCVGQRATQPAHCDDAETATNCETEAIGRQ